MGRLPSAAIDGPLLGHDDARLVRFRVRVRVRVRARVGARARIRG